MEKIQIVDVIEHDFINKYQICIFGITKKSNNSICVKINNYEPFFYLRKNSFIQCTDNEFLEGLKNSTINVRVKGRIVSKRLKDIVKNFELLDTNKTKIFDHANVNKDSFFKISFNNLQDFKSVKYNFESIRNISIKGFNFVEKCEDDIEPYVRFLHEKELGGAGWFHVKKFTKVMIQRFSKCKEEILVDYKDVIKSNSSLQIGKLKIASFDIETTSIDDKFPDFKNKRNPIIQIGTTVSILGEKGSKMNYIATLGNCNPIKDTIVKKCSNEKELIVSWCSFIEKLDPDVITGYNINGYDFEYIFERAMRFGLFDSIQCLSRVKYPLNKKDIETLNTFDYSSRYDEIDSNKNVQYAIKKIYQKVKSSSKNKGDLTMKYIITTGRVNLDLLKYCREKGDSLESYKLDFVSKHYGLDKGKNDMAYKEIFRIYNPNTPKSKINTSNKTKVAEYCLQDCLLCNQLIEKLNVLPNCIGMSNACFITLNNLLFKGEGKKIHSLVLKFCREMNYIIPNKNNRYKSIVECIKGATVLDANKGSYFEPVSCLDFASLYPSCIISHNLCPSTKIKKCDINKLDKKYYKTISWEETINGEWLANWLTRHEKRFQSFNRKYSSIIRFNNMNLNWVTIFKEYKKTTFQRILSSNILSLYKNRNYIFFKRLGFNFDDLKLVTKDNKKGKKEEMLVTNINHYFLDRSIKKGVIPVVLNKLLNKRKDAKKLMKEAKKDGKDFLAKIYDGLQLAYKITANSVYGQLGSSFCIFGNSGVAGSVTATGRDLLLYSNDLIKKNFCASEVVYGDTDSLFIKYQLKKHSGNCPNHPKYSEKRFSMYNIKKIEGINNLNNVIENNNIKCKHSVAMEVMLNHSNAKLYEVCNCKVMNNDNSTRKELLNESIRMAKESERLITNMLPYNKKLKNGVHELEYEKTYFPFFLFSKKRYIGKMYVNDINDYKIDYKGIVLKRRDNCILLKKFYMECIKNLFCDNNNIEKSIDILKLRLKELKDGSSFNIEDFVLSKSIKDLDSYKIDPKTKMPTVAHAYLAKKVKLRDPGKAFKPGSRIPYCFIKNKSNKNVKQIHMIETVDYIKENNLKLDYKYYIKNQLAKPIIELYNCVGKDITSLFKGDALITSFFGSNNNKKSKRYNRLLPVTNNNNNFKKYDRLLSTGKQNNNDEIYKRLLPKKTQSKLNILPRRLKRKIIKQDTLSYSSDKPNDLIESILSGSSKYAIKN